MITQLAASVRSSRPARHTIRRLRRARALERAESSCRKRRIRCSALRAALDLDPDRLAQVEKAHRPLHSAARKFRLQPETLPAIEHEARSASRCALDAAADLEALQRARHGEGCLLRRRRRCRRRAPRRRRRWRGRSPRAMQELSMAGGSFEVALRAAAKGRATGPNRSSFCVAGHAGVRAAAARQGRLGRRAGAHQPRARGRSRARRRRCATLIFDEVDTGIGGAVAEVVGRLLQQLGARAPGALRHALAAGRGARRSASAGGQGNRLDRKTGLAHHVTGSPRARRGTRAHARRHGHHRAPAASTRARCSRAKPRRGGLTAPVARRSLTAPVPRRGAPRSARLVRRA